jgi:hypothetical protein
VQDGDAQGELVETNGVEASRTLHAASSKAIDEIPRVSVYVAENTEANRAEIAKRAPVAISQPAPAVNVTQAHETISVTWGEELFTPVSYCSFRVGPFSASTTLRAGESREQAGDRLMRELEKIAAKERDNKIRVFKDALDKVIPRKGAAS